MAENDAELQVMIEALHIYLPGFQVNKADFHHPTSHFVINLYTKLISKINEETAFSPNIVDPTPFTSVINTSDEESTIFGIFQYVYHIFFQLQYDFVNITDLYCPTAKRTKCICKTLIMVLDNLNDISESLSEIESRLASEASNEKLQYDERDNMKKELSDKAKSVGVLKNETDRLVTEHLEIEKKESDLKIKYEEKMKILSQEQGALNQKLEMLTRDEELIMNLEREELGLQEEVVSCDEIENVKNSLDQIQNDISLLEEEVIGFEGCLESKEIELKAYEEVILKIAKLQSIDLSEVEKLYKLGLNVKSADEQILSTDRKVVELKEAKAKQNQRTKTIKEGTKENVTFFNKEKKNILLKLQELEERKKNMKKQFLQLQRKEDKLTNRLNNAKRELHEVYDNRKETQEQFKEACDEIIISTNNTTETVRKILTELESRIIEVYGTKK